MYFVVLDKSHDVTNTNSCMSSVSLIVSEITVASSEQLWMVTVPAGWQPHTHDHSTCGMRGYL